MIRTYVDAGSGSYVIVGVRLDLPADIGSATFEIVSREDIESA